MEPNSKKFTKFFPNIENTPFSDEEACRILDISSSRFNRATKQGLIQKSVDFHYRHDVFFEFMNIFDIFEYALRADLFFLNYGCHSEVSELVFSLVDELASIIEDCIYTSTFPQIDRIKIDIGISCMDNAEKWNAYWLYGGDSFSSTKCSAIVLQTWSNIFERTMSVKRNAESEIIEPPDTARPTYH